MSASPAAPSPSVSDGKTPPVGPGNIRRMKARPAGDPLRMGAKRKPIPKPLGAGAGTARTAARPNANGLQAVSNPAAILATPSAFAIPKNQGPGPELPQGPAVVQTTFSEAPLGEYRDFALVTTKKAMRESLHERYHIARFASKKKIDLMNQDEFVRPVTLHRRDPNAPVAGKEAKPDPDEMIDDKEREKLDIAKEEKARQRAADLALIAPSGNNAAAMAQKRNQAFRGEKTTQIYRIDKTEEDRKRSDLRYEEALPWHLEDAETKQTWVGSYESALSDTNVILVPEHGVFKMIPVEKWYKFTAKNHFKSMTIEEAEAQMKKKSKPTRWAMHDEENSQSKKELQETRMRFGTVFGVKKESASFKNSGKRELEDTDDLDFDAEGLFQDDDEQVTVEPVDDEESKTTQDKIKKEQMGANLFGDADELEIEKELEKEQAEEKLRKVNGKGIKKALKKREKNHLHESDSEDNDPFNESGVSTYDYFLCKILTPCRIHQTIQQMTKRWQKKIVKRMKKRKPKPKQLDSRFQAQPAAKALILRQEALIHYVTIKNESAHPVCLRLRQAAMNLHARNTRRNTHQYNPTMIPMHSRRRATPLLA